MTIHIGAKKGDIAPSILLPGDPMRAKYIADNFIDNAVCYNEVRGMYGFTGTYKGKPVSVQGTGMGVPSIGIYVNELIDSYGVQNLIRIGTCGAVNEDTKLRDVILAMSASTDSSMNQRVLHADYAPTASFELLVAAYDEAKKKSVGCCCGNVLTSDSFYNVIPDEWKVWAEYGVLGIEMESAALYTIAARKRVRALSILTVSDHIMHGTQLSSEERQGSLHDMIEISLETVCKIS